MKKDTDFVKLKFKKIQGINIKRFLFWEGKLTLNELYKRNIGHVCRQ